MILAEIYRHYNDPPSFSQAVVHVLVGVTFFNLSFFIHQHWIGKLHFKLFGKTLLKSQIVEISVMLVSSTFAVLICLISVTGKSNDIPDKFLIGWGISLL